MLVKLLVNVCELIVQKKKIRPYPYRVQKSMGRLMRTTMGLISSVSGDMRGATDNIEALVLIFLCI
jgi:hypothetical protein